MRIDCPHCGERDSSEFTYHGDATLQRPQGDLEAAAETQMSAFHDYVYLRDNPDGIHHEHWYHAMGCRAWLVVTRDMRTHALSRVVQAGGGPTT